MKPTHFLPLLALLAASAAPAQADDPRQLVTMPAPMVRHMLGNMREHLQALGDIQRFLAKREFQKAAETAETRIGLSSLAAHGAAHMAPFMPQAMQDIGTQMHRAASRFALVAQEAGADDNMARALEALSAVTAQCVACHSAFRVH